MMKKTYEVPEIEIQMVMVEDEITSSGPEWELSRD